MNAEPIGVLLAIVVGSLLTAILVRLGAKLFAKTVVPYKKAYLMALGANAASYAVSVIAGAVSTSAGLTSAIALVGGFFIGALIYGMAITRENGKPIRLGYGLAIQFLSLAIFLIPILTISLIVG